MERLKDLLNDLVVDHWAKLLTGIVLFFLGRWWGKFRARKDWARREFMHRLMVTINSIVPGPTGKPTLAIRTVLENDLAQVLLNAVAVDRVLAAAKLTTPDAPIVPVSADDRWFVLNAILNEISEHFALGTLARDQGLPVKTTRYLLCLTNEVAGSLRTHKMRAMVMQKDLLVSGAFEKDLAVENPNHDTRLKTLEQLRAAYAKDASNFLELEIVVPV
jgi:hypothetical protein